MTTTLSNGRGWLADVAAASIARIDKNYGGPIPITSAGRTYAQQAEAYRKYLAGTGSYALPPGTSIHEKGMAVDFGSSSWGWLQAALGLGWNGARANDFGWRRTVKTESWHMEYDEVHDNALFQELLNGSGGYSLTVDGEFGPKSQAALKDFQSKHGLVADGIPGPKSLAALKAAQPASGGSTALFPAYDAYGEAWVKAIQDKLNRLGYGPLTVDGRDGPATQAEVKKFQTKVGITADGIAGPITNNHLDEALAAAPVVGRNITDRPTVEIQKFLISKNLLAAGGADGEYGPATTAAVMKYQTSVGLGADGIWGPITDAKAFPAPPVTPPATDWPTNGRNTTTRPTADIQRLVGATPDGVYGPLTSVAVAKWQSSKQLTADGIWGPASDAVGFPGVPLPDAPADPTTDPMYGKKIPTYPGATWADISPNKSVRAGTIEMFIVHHRADTGSAESARKRFMTTNDRSVSPNWNINQDGTVDEIVPPDNYRAWTTGPVDHQAVTVETGNTSGAPAWGISQPSHEAIAQLIAWASDRYKFPIQKGVVVGTAFPFTVEAPGIVAHRDTPAGKSTGTICPGPSMNMDWLINRAKDIYTEKYTTQQPPPVDPEEPTEPTIPAGMALVPKEFLENLQANEQANADEIGKYLA